ncbi:MAG TPA: Sir2 family NAD-dependent protein deacetylase [Chthoniobacterales bacterium]|jgi:NAD-dependent deacetylase
MPGLRVLVITGAGISAESGIPTFRGKDGYWRNLDPTKLATPEAFDHDPNLVWEWYRERRSMIRAAHPNPAHAAITKLAHNSSDFLLVTQNVDNLHSRAQQHDGTIPSEKIVQIHGDIFLTRCSRCDWHYHETERDRPELPMCRHCGAMMRPGVVWFGENLDPAQIARVETYIDNGPCDAVFVVGTTALFGYIVDWSLRGAGSGGQLIEVNPDSTTLSQFATRSVRQPAGVALPKLVEELLSS